jgi:hypothetical protein
MKVDSVVRDVLTSLRRVSEALSNNLTASDNLSSEGGKKGQVLVNMGPGQAPQWMDKADVPDNS